MTARFFAGLLPRAQSISFPRLQPVNASILIVGLIASAGGYLAIDNYATSRLQRDHDRASDRVSSILIKSVDRQIGIANSAAAMFSGPKAKVDRWSFFKFAQTLPGKNPGLSAVEWIPKVSGKQRSRFEKKATADGLFDFNFVQRATNGRNVKATRRTSYFPIYYVEPYTGNEKELGLDLAADSTGEKFLARVRDTGQAVIAHSELGSSTGDSNSGFSVVMPVYRSSVAPFTVKERRRALSGYVRVKFRFDKLLETLRSGVGELPDLDIFIFSRDSKNSYALINYFSSQPGQRAAQPINAKTAFEGAYTAVEHEVAGRNWNIVIKPVGGAFPNMIGLTGWGFVAFTLILTALLLRHLTTLRVAREEAEAANRAKSEFLAMMSHELRTPLNAVIGFSDMMISELFGPLSNTHYKEYTANINRSATHLLGLINSILDLTKAEAGYYELDIKRIALSDIWGAVYPGLQAGIKDSGITVEETLSESALMLDADPEVLNQVLHNLVSNAITYTPSGGTVSVQVEAYDDGELILRIADTGIGISEENLELVLKPFRQVDNSLARKYEGVGLGLPLTRMLVEIHGGDLAITSELNEGTEVTVTLPGIVVLDDKATEEITEDDPSVEKEKTLAETEAEAEAEAKAEVEAEVEVEVEAEAEAEVEVEAEAEVEADAEAEAEEEEDQDEAGQKRANARR